jgi:site-specific recombinase XerD
MQQSSSERETTLTLESIDKFRNLLSAKGLSDNTALAYGKDIKAFLESCDGFLSTIDFSSCATYWLRMSRRTLAPSTVNRRLSSLKSFAKVMHLDSHELDDYKTPKPLKANPHPLPEGVTGVVRMIEATDNLEHRVLVALCGLCGLRISETLTIRASSIDSHTLTLTVTGKGDKTRRVPISDAAWTILEEAYCRSFLDDDRAFVGIGNRSARRTVTSLGRRADLVRRVASHDLRATFATNLLQKGVNLRIIQELLGHSSIAVTEAYLGVTNDEMKAAVNL